MIDRLFMLTGDLLTEPQILGADGARLDVWLSEDRVTARKEYLKTLAVDVQKTLDTQVEKPRPERVSFCGNKQGHGWHLHGDGARYECRGLCKHGNPYDETCEWC